MAKITRTELVAIHPVEHINVELLIRVYAFTLQQLAEWPFMRGVVCGSLKKELNRSASRQCIVRYPLREGVAYRVGNLAIDRYFEFHSDGAILETLFNAADVAHTMYAILNAWEEAGIPENVTVGFEHECEVYRIEYDRRIGLKEDFFHREEGWWHFVQHDGLRLLGRLCAACSRDRAYRSIRHAYALEIADRLLHDRQISGLIAAELTRLSPLIRGESAIGECTKFVKRIKWPAFVKPLIYARDRGKCAYCKIDIAAELLAKAHVDHIYPLSHGGSNDVVNLQLACEDCNRKKQDNEWGVSTSVPGYHERLTEKRLVPRRKLPNRRY